MHRLRLYLWCCPARPAVPFGGRRASIASSSELQVPRSPMPVDHIRYDILAQEALRGMVRNVLTDAAKKGLPGDHHFFITFDTTRRGRAAVRPAARAISRGNDHRPAAPVLGSQGERRRVRGRAVVRRRAGAAARAVRGDQELSSIRRCSSRCSSRTLSRERRRTRPHRRTEAREPTKHRRQAGKQPSGKRRAPQRQRQPDGPAVRAAAASCAGRSDEPSGRQAATDKRAAPRSCGSTASARSDGAEIAQPRRRA